MRASFVGGIKKGVGETEILRGDCLHHLLNVARVKKGQGLKLLDGKGKSAFGVIESISKKSVEVKIERVETFERSANSISVAFARPKKDALEFCLRASVETGAEKIYVLHSERSQTYPSKPERYQKILETALEQSNNPFMPELVSCSLSELNIDDYDYCALASLQSSRDRKEDKRQRPVGYWA